MFINPAFKMKKIAFSLAFLAVFVSNIHLAQARFLPERIELLQGNTLEIRVPAWEWSEVRGQFKDENVPFYQARLEPRFDEPITRAEFLRLLINNHDFGEVNFANYQEFPDVNGEHPFYIEVMTAKAKEIVHGYENGEFGPYDFLTRGQIAKILVETFEPEEQWTEEDLRNEVKSFSDVPEDHVFKQYIEDAVRAGYFQGYPDGLMRPDRRISFDEAKIVIERVTGLGQLETLGKRDYFRAFVGAHRLNDLGEKQLLMTYINQDGEELSEQSVVDVLKREYPVHSFSLSSDKTALFADDIQEKTWAMIDAAKANPEANQLWEEEFIKPTVGELTLGFGDLLYINGSYAGSHFGYDWANRSKPAIWASNSGKITLSDWTPAYGNTVIIDHGQNVFTMYLHLDSLAEIRKAGDYVKKGDVIGFMGDTGIATGVHLHFNHFVGDIIVDSQEWMDGKY